MIQGLNEIVKLGLGVKSAAVGLPARLHSLWLERSLSSFSFRFCCWSASSEARNTSRSNPPPQLKNFSVGAAAYGQYALDCQYLLYHCYDCQYPLYHCYDDFVRSRRSVPQLLRLQLQRLRGYRPAQARKCRLLLLLRCYRSITYLVLLHATSVPLLL